MIEIVFDILTRLQDGICYEYNFVKIFASTTCRSENFCGKLREL